MGRVYCVQPDEAKGERSGRGCRVTTVTGVRIPFPVRVEFDADADEGMATLTVYVTSADGQVLIDYQKDEACQATIRTWVKVWPRGVEVKQTPEMRVWCNGAGDVIAMPDPFPAIPFESKKG